MDLSDDLPVPSAPQDQAVDTHNYEKMFEAKLVPILSPSEAERAVAARAVDEIVKLLQGLPSWQGKVARTVGGRSFYKRTDLSCQFDIDLVSFINTSLSIIPPSERMAMLQEAQRGLARAYGALIIKKAGDRRLCFMNQGLEVDLILVENWWDPCLNWCRCCRGHLVPMPSLRQTLSCTSYAVQTSLQVDQTLSRLRATVAVAGCSLG